MAFSELCCLFYGFWHIGKFGGGKKDESPCTVVFGANTMVFRANTVYFVWKIQQYFGYSVFFCLFFNTVVFSGKYSGILGKKIKFRVNTMILWASRGMFGGHDISLYVGKYEKANKILNISGTIS